MRQLNLFDHDRVPPANPPHSGPETSRRAAEAIKPSAGKLRRLVHWFIAQRGPAGATDKPLTIDEATT